ncbi:hypothetical protein ASE75_08340 [Sphingomonas sp. Leaf17]|uniref:hypothetical protein n=1 Tax=Sphingomonas sp. Leaf17 TaxID=1735683 RepID=UPI0006FC7F5C|nr:hypothetical protein [Sphingomonas sp. Leaf17]KQM65046.1 hypothetical protein ASE75_08340 [Sphingomonas sp. Leaf17]
MNEACAPAPDRFRRFAAIDWSGARGARHKGIALATCDSGTAAPTLVDPPDSVWSRTQILDWLLAHRDEPMIVGFDFSFSAPFVARGAHLPGEPETADARALWAHVDANSADTDLGAAGFLEARRGTHFYLGAADGRKADFLHYRACEAWAGGKPSTVYDAIGAAQVAKASFAGMRLLHALDGRIPVWPFDPVPDSGAVIVEIYTAIAARAGGVRKGRSKLRDGESLDAALAALGCDPHAGLATYDDHRTDAILTAAWLRATAHTPTLWSPPAMTAQIAATEGWTFGIS